jgi:uncharacterized membrane protein YphA (DoxX/SURF4 family)
VDPDAWHDEIVKTFKGRAEALSEDQKGRLAELRDKVKASGSVDFDWIYVRDTVLQIPPAGESERFTAQPYLQSSAGPFRPAFRTLVRDIDGLDVNAAMDRRAEQIASHYGFTAEQRTKLAQARDQVKAQFAATWSAPDVQARLADYRLMRSRVGALSDAGAPFQRERVAEDRKKLDQIAGDLLALANEPGDELAVQAFSIATVAQMSAGPAPRVPATADWVDGVIKWGLTAIGGCLLLGLFTRYAAIAAAAQLALFYFASPPWPGLPASSLGGHYLFVDRNLIELIAAGVVAVSASGKVWRLYDSQRATTADGQGQLPGRAETDAAPVHAGAGGAA